MATERSPEDLEGACCGGGDAALEELFAHYVNRLNGGEKIDADTILCENPGVGRELLDYLERFIDVGIEEAGRPLGTLGDYILRRQIGRGGMGVVYDAWQGSLDRRVALKVLPAGVAADDKAFHRFMREAKTAAQLNHQNVVAVYGMGVEQNTPYYSMEFVEGETLAQILTRIKEIEPEAETVFGKKDRPGYFEKLAEAFGDVADGLQHAHSNGVTHRDIKPSNLILDSDCRLRILDFGLARLEGQESLTVSGDLVGTPLYMSPEQARRRKVKVDHRTDVYSLGATVYEAICGRPPFRGKDHADTLSQIIDRDPVEPRKVVPRLPKDLETIVLKCLRKDPGDRYGTAEALGQDLRRFVRGDPIEARPRSRIDFFSRALVRHRRRLAWLGIVVALAVGTGLFALRVQGDRAAGIRRHYDRIVRETSSLFHTGFATMRFDAGGRLAEVRTIAKLFFGGHVYLANPVLREPLIAAVESLAEARRLMPSRPDAYYQSARGLWILGETDAALRACAEALRRDRSFVPARVLEAVLRAETGHQETVDSIVSASTATADGAQRWTALWIHARQLVPSQA